MEQKFLNDFLVLPASSWCVLRVRDKITLSTKGCAIFCLTFIVLLYLIAKHPISHLQKRLHSLRKRMILKKRYRFRVMHIFSKTLFLLSRKLKGWKKTKKEHWTISIYRGIKSEVTRFFLVYAYFTELRMLLLFLELVFGNSLISLKE